MKKIFLMFVIFFSVMAVSGAEMFYSNGTSVPMKKSEEVTAVKSSATDAGKQKNTRYRMDTGSSLYIFVRGKSGSLPVYFLGDEAVVAERTVFWRGKRSVEYMEKQYGMKLAEIFPTYPLYAFSVKGDSVEIAEKIVKNGDGYAFPDLVRETVFESVPESTPKDPYFNVQWHLHNTGIGKYYYSNSAPLDGDILENADIKFLQTLEFLNSNGIEVDTSAKIAIMDSGVAPDHEDLTNLESGYDAIENKDGAYPDYDGSDGDAHGTECAGISAGVGNTIGMSGVCPWCRIYPVKWLKGNGSTQTSTSAIISVYEKYVADQNITTINCSFGAPYSLGNSYVDSGTVEALQNFMQNGRGGKGGVIVFSSGNESVDSSYKRILEYDFKFKRNGVNVTDRVVSVSATTAWDTRAEYSNYGYATTVSAPSLTARPTVGLATATIPGLGDYPEAGGDYTIIFSGTSAAAPVVSGLFGVLFSINPALTLEEAVKILKQSADKINPETGFWDENGFSVKYGYGRVNLEKAARLAMGFPMCKEVKSEVCGNHLDDDCDGYVDEECSKKLTTGKGCTKNEDCRQAGSSTLDDVMCVSERLSYVFKGGYCFSKSFVQSNIHGKPCPDGTKLFDKEGYDNICALECNSAHPCEREGYYCTDEVLGVCLPLCSDNSDCTEGSVCNENGHCVSKCGNGELDEGEACDYGENNGVMNCDYGKTSCKVCTADCKQEKSGKTSYCGDGYIDIRNGETCDNGYYNGMYGSCSSTCSEYENPDDDENFDDDDEITDAGEKTDVDEISDSEENDNEETSDNAGMPDNEEISDDEEISDSSETSNDSENSDGKPVLSDEDVSEGGESTEEPTYDDNTASDENKKKSDGCSVLVL